MALDLLPWEGRFTGVSERAVVTRRMKMSQRKGGQRRLLEIFHDIEGAQDKMLEPDPVSERQFAKAQSRCSRCIMKHPEEGRRCSNYAGPFLYREVQHFPS